MSIKLSKVQYKKRGHKIEAIYPEFRIFGLSFYKK